MNYEFKELQPHIGHNITCVNYGDDNVSIECEDCNCVLYTVEKFNDEQNDNEKVIIVSEYDDETSSISKNWVFKDKEKAQKFIDILSDTNDEMTYDLEELVFEDNYLEFNSDNSDLIGKCFTVTKEGEQFSSKLEVKSLSDIIDEFGYDYNCSYRNKKKERIPYWLKYDDCTEIEERIQKSFE